MAQEINARQPLVSEKSSQNQGYQPIDESKVNWDKIEEKFGISKGVLERTGAKDKGGVRETTECLVEGTPMQGKVVAPANESETQVAVNSEGKTNEQTKGVKEPL